MQLMAYTEEINLFLTSKNIKSSLPVLAVVSIEDVADNHAGLSHRSITNQHAAQLFPRPVWFFMSLRGLCHLSSPLSKQVHAGVQLLL